MTRTKVIFKVSDRFSFAVPH